LRTIIFGLVSIICFQHSFSEKPKSEISHFQGETVVAIPGATKENHVMENTGAMSFRLSDEDMARLDQVSSVFK